MTPTFPQQPPATGALGYRLAFTCLICAIWIVPALFGHDPWKPDEAHNFGVVYEMLRGSGWVVPMIAGEPHVEEPPLFHLFAALTATLLAPVLPLHDGARLASGLAIAITLLFVGRAARELYGPGRGWVSVLILISCVGLLVRGHQIIPDLGMLAGLAIALYALALAPRRPLPAGAWLGTGLGVIFMSEGLIEAALLAALAVSLAAFGPWRTRACATTLGVALVAASPWLVVWPTALYLESPALLREWLHAANLDRFFGTNATPLASRADFYLRHIAWYTFPALPLALWTVWSARRAGFGAPGITLPLWSFAVILVALSVASDVRELYALPLLLPLALLANPAIGTLRRGAANAFYWFGIMGFTVFFAAAWFYWSALDLAVPAKLHQHLQRIQPGYVHGFAVWKLALGAAITLAWFALVVWLKRSNERPLIVWASGLALSWALAATLFLGWADAGKSYRTMVKELAAAIPKGTRCISSIGLGEPQRAMLQYYAGIVTWREEKAQRRRACELVLVQGVAREPFRAQRGWVRLWDGARPGDKTERFWLYRRQG